MKRLAITFFVLLAAVAAGIYGYGYISKQLAPSPLPPEVTAAENALAVPGLIAIARFDVYFARRLEELLAGFGDKDALPNPVRDDRSFPGLIKAAGVDFTQNIDHVLGAFVLNETSAQPVALLFGRFPAEKILQSLQGAYDIAEETAGENKLLILSRKNPENCQAPENFALNLTQGRMVFGNRDLVIRTLERIGNASEGYVDIKNWRDYSKDKIFAAALLLPGEVEKISSQPMVSAMLGSMRDNISALKGVYIGGMPQIFPLGLRVEVQIAATKEWAEKSAAAVYTWQENTRAQIGEDLPSLAALLESLNAFASNERLVLETGINNDLNRNITSLPGEIMSFMFGGLRVTDKNAAPDEEKTVAQDTLPQFVMETAHDRLPAFEKEDFNTAATSGPFGIRVKNLQIKSLPDGDIAEITLETRSSDIPNTPSDNSHIGVTGDSYASLQVTRAYDGLGNDLLRDEPCGAERNSKPASLQSTTAGRFVGNEFKGFTELNGEKTLRLKAGENPENISRLEGYVRLRLPVKTRTLHLKPPFAGKIVQNSKARIKLLSSRSKNLRYQVSGQTDMILDVRAKNEENEYLASSGATAMDRVFDAGRIVEREYKGKPAWAEIVFADEIVEKDYPFVIEKFAPKFPVWDFPEGFTVTTATKEVFLATPAPVPAEESGLQNCKADPKTRQTWAPLVACGWQPYWAFGKKINGRFEFMLPMLGALANNPSALEVNLKKLNLKDGRALDIKAGAFASLSQAAPENSAIEEALTLEFETPEAVTVDQIESAEGQITLRLPTALRTMTLDTGKIGNSALNLALFDQQSAEIPIASAKLIGLSEGKIEIEIQGERSKIVQLLPRGPEGAALKTLAPEVRQTAPDKTVYSLRVSGRPATVDIVYAATQDKISYDFELPALQQPRTP